jgi:hypothetical protein
MEDCINHWYISPIIIAQSYGGSGASYIQEVSLGKKILGEMLRALAGTLGGAALIAAGVTTLGSCGDF